MEINEAVDYVKQHIMRTNKSAVDGVTFCWNRLDISDEDLDALAQEGFRVRVGEALRSGDVYAPSISDGVRTSVRVTGRTNEERAVLRVSVVLSETYLETDTGRKAIVQFTPSDCRAYVNRQLDIENGCRRHRNVMEHVERRLRACGKRTVADLGQCEQDIIARAWIDAREGRDTNELERFKKPPQKETARKAARA